MSYLDRGTFKPSAFSKHFMAAPTAVSSWYTFTPLSEKHKQDISINVKGWQHGILGLHPCPNTDINNPNPCSFLR
jgi:hypothetical protein